MHGVHRQALLIALREKDEAHDKELVEAESQWLRNEVMGIVLFISVL